MDRLAKLRELYRQIEDHSYDDDQELHYDLIQEAIGVTDHHSTNLVIQSWRGQDMHAAREFYETMLPITRQYSIQTDPTCLKVKVVWWPHGLSGKHEFSAHAWGDLGQEGLAWLKATVRTRIKAMEAGVYLEVGGKPFRAEA